jgi:L-threonylcarbamoyladenylate synthase
MERSNAVDDAAIEAAAKRLRRGGVVAFPTETVYGLGANALDERAVARVFEIKGRPRFDPLIVHVAQLADVAPLVAEFDPRARRLAERFWPGPLTLVLPKSAIVPDIVTAGLPSVAVRVPDHAVAIALIRRAGVPVAAPSANRFGAISPTTAQHVRDSLGDEVDVVLDGGPCATGVESTVVSFAAPGAPQLLRPGGTPVEAIEAVGGIGPLRRLGAAAGDLPQASPGMLERHYAPMTKLAIATRRNEASLAPRPGERVARLCFRGEPRDASRYAAIEVLSATGDLREAAAKLFAALRRLDALGVDRIVAEEFPSEGLGLAIRDRLQRASR